jgi:uncharacterized protein
LQQDNKGSHVRKVHKTLRGGPALTSIATIVAAFVVAPLAVGAAAGAASYRQSVERWRQQYEASLRSDDGWLTVSGLFWLHEGRNEFGSDPLNDIVLPAPAAPAAAGYFEFHDGKTLVHVSPGVDITMGGKPVSLAELRPDSPADRLRLGGLTLYLHASGARYAIRLKDTNSKLRQDFTGLSWFPVDESYRVTARYVPYDTPKQVEVENVMGDFVKDFVAGYVVFSLHGAEYRLDAEQDEQDKTLSFVFRDLTSGKETYGASRFLDVDAPKNGTVVLDFNEAYNPPCAYNRYTTCPLPLPQNRLRVEIRAGEKIYQHRLGD